MAVLVEHIPTRQARLIMAQAVRTILRNGLQILGISAPEYMAREMENKDGE